MTRKELQDILDNYPEDATIVVGVTIPDLYINTVANASVSGNNVDTSKCTKVQLLAEVPSRFQTLKVYDVEERPVQAG